MRVAAGRDQLEQMPADKRAADEAEAAEALQNYIAQEQTYFAREKKYIAQMASLHRVAQPDVTQPVAPRPPQLQTEARRQHSKWDGMRDASLNAGTVLRQEERATHVTLEFGWQVYTPAATLRNSVRGVSPHVS